MFGAGLLCNTFAPRAVDAVRPVLPVLSLVDTCCCVGASLTGAAAARSPIAAQVLLPVHHPDSGPKSALTQILPPD